MTLCTLNVGQWWLVILVLLAAFALAAAPAAARLSIDHAVIRLDRYPVPVERWQWAEAWGEIRQFFPRYYEPAATLHCFVHNEGASPVDITALQFNGRPIAEVTTRADYAGPVIWYRSNPEVLAPGAMGMIYVRLRETPTEPVTVSVGAASTEVSVVVDRSHYERVRLGYVGYNDAIDTIYAYVENWSEENLRVARVSLDGQDVTERARFVNERFRGGPALVVIELATPLAYGSFHVLQVATHEGPIAAAQIRARDDRFYLGIVQGQTPLSEYWAKFFNTLYRLHGSHPETPGWWDADSELARLGFTIIQPGPTEAAVRAGATVPPGRIIYNGVDEPDAHEPAGLPYMQRSGINAMRLVEPPMLLQRRHDPHHDTMILVDRTYAPLNWHHYGELPDIFIQDCYSPTQWMGYDLQVVPNQTEAVVTAVAPRPAHMMLWGNMNTGYPMRRSPTPDENDMSVHYVVGEGAKGLYYFLDWNSYPTVFEGGYYIGAPRTNMLWRQMGRANAKLMRIASLLAIGHPFQIARSEDPHLHVRTLLCGPDNFVLVLVNRNHRIHPSDRHTKQPHIFPVRDAVVEIEIPSWFDLRAAVEVDHDGCRPVTLSKRLLSRTHRLHVDELRTGMILVLSRDGDIAKKLTLPEEQWAALAASETPRYVTDEPLLKEQQHEAVIKLDEAALAAGSLTLDLRRPETLAQAAQIAITGSLYQEPGQWLALHTHRDWHGEAVLTFVCESPVPLSEVRASLRSMTPNFVACADNVIALSRDGAQWAQDSSFKMEWNGGYAGETLNVALTAPEDETMHRFQVRVMMRDPGIVYSTEATNVVFGVDLSWQTAETLSGDN